METLSLISTLSYTDTKRRAGVFRVHLCNLSPGAINLAQILPLSESEGLVRASEHHSVKCLYLQIRQGQSTKCPAVQVAAQCPPSAWGQTGIWREDSWKHTGFGRIKCSSLKLPCVTCPSPLHSTGSGLGFDMKACLLSESLRSLSKVNRIWTSKHPKQAPTTHVNV